MTKESYQTIFCLSKLICNHPKLFDFNHRIIYCDQRVIKRFFALRNCNHPKLFYSNHRIIYCDQRVIKRFFALRNCNHPKLFYSNHRIIYCDQRVIKRFFALRNCNHPKLFILTTALFTTSWYLAVTKELLSDFLSQ